MAEPDPDPHQLWGMGTIAGPSFGRRAVRGGAAMLAAQAVQFALQMAATVILARLLSPEDFGLIAMAATAMNFVFVFKDLGLSHATVRWKEISNNQITTLFYINVGASLVFMAATVALAPLLATLYGRPELFNILVVLAASFLVAGLSAQHQALLQRHMRFDCLAAIMVVSAIVAFGVGIAGALAGLRYWALVAMQLASLCFACVGYWVASGWRPGLPRRDSELCRMLAFGGNLTGFNIVNYFARNADNVLIGWYWGVASLGFYTRAYALFMTPIRQINGPLSSVLLPTLSRLSNDPVRYRQVFLRVLKMLLIVTAPLAGLMIATGDWIAVVLLGPDWTEAGEILAWLAIAALTQPASHLTGVLFISQGRASELFRWGMVGGSLSTASFVVGLPFGPPAVAASYAVSGLLIRTPILFAMAGAQGPVSALDLYRTAAVPVFSGLIVLFVLYLLRVTEMFPAGAAGLASAVALTPFLSVAPLAAFPAGRSALKDAVVVARTAMASRRATLAPGNS